MLNIAGIRALGDDDNYEITLSDNGASNSFTLQANDPQGCVVQWDKALDSLSHDQQNDIFEALWAFHLARHPENKSSAPSGASSEEAVEDIKAQALAYQDIIKRSEARSSTPESFRVIQKHLDMHK